MNNWKEQLKIKEKELNLEGGELNDGSGVSSRSNNRSSSSIGSAVSSEKRKNINKDYKKGGIKMITVEGALKDLEAIEQEATDSGAKSVVKALKVMVKFLSTMRSNQLLTDGDKVRIKEARKAREDKKEKK